MDNYEELGGTWTFMPRVGTIEYVLGNGNCLYQIDLEYCRTSAQVLDWIMQVALKTWATDRTVAGLVRMLDKILDPQSRLCSFGQEQGPISKGALRDICRKWKQAEEG